MGEWHGSFTHFSPQGEQLDDIPTLVSLESLNNNQTVRHVVRYLPPDQPPSDTLFEYSSLNRGILLFENGAFSQGSLQWDPFAEFGAEFGFILGERRLRMVMFFNRQAVLDRLTLIREHLADTNTVAKPPLTVNQLLGEWTGTATTIYPDWRSPDTYSTHLQIDSQGDSIRQQLTFGDRTITSVATLKGSCLYFAHSNLSVQIVMLPDGASANFPEKILPRQNFVLEAGWLINPRQRQRLIRTYNSKDEWLSLTLVEEEKVK